MPSLLRKWEGGGDTSGDLRSKTWLRGPSTPERTAEFASSGALVEAFGGPMVQVLRLPFPNGLRGRRLACFRSKDSFFPLADSSATLWAARIEEHLLLGVLEPCKLNSRCGRCGIVGVGHCLTPHRGERPFLWRDRSPQVIYRCAKLEEFVRHCCLYQRPTQPVYLREI